MGISRLYGGIGLTDKSNVGDLITQVEGDISSQIDYWRELIKETSSDLVCGPLSDIEKELIKDLRDHKMGIRRISKLLNRSERELSVLVHIQESSKNGT